VNGGERVRQGIDGFMEEQTLSVQGQREVATMSEYSSGAVRFATAVGAGSQGDALFCQLGEK